MFLHVAHILFAVSLGHAAYLEQRAPTTAVPDYFQTTPELFPGPTATGQAPFLAETNPAPFGPRRTFVPNTPLETDIPISGAGKDDTSIFQLMGQLSPYFPNPNGFGVDEYPLPSGSNISQVQMIHRHGSRYPSVNSTVEKYARNLSAYGKSVAVFSGNLSFLNDWSYKLGEELLVRFGESELFDSGVLHYYQYGHLYDPSTKIIARTTTQDRMLKSAENFLAGFFGLAWTDNAKLEVIIEESKFNNSLGGDLNCPNFATGVSAGGTNASVIWENNYLANAVTRFQKMSKNFTWNITSVYYAQSLCPYETVALGYSAFCDLFTYDEWKGFEYSYDLVIDGNYFFQSPTGRAVGIGYVEEVLARLEHHLLSTPNTQANITLDNMASTFPLDQPLYFDFSHISTIIGVLTAFGLTQFNQFLPTSGPPRNQQMITSHLQPNAGRLDIEIISAPHPVPADRTATTSGYLSGNATKYVHFVLNQRTIPLGVSLSACGQRSDGWCELETFLKIQSNALADSQFNYACFGKYPAVPYGNITNGVPLPTRSA